MTRAAAASRSALGASPSQEPRETLRQAQELVLALLGDEREAFDELRIEHVEEVLAQLRADGADPALLAGACLGLACDRLSEPATTLGKRFDAATVGLALNIARLLGLTRRLAEGQTQDKPALAGAQHELIRRMLIGFTHDLRAALVVLVSRLINLRHVARQKTDAQTPGLRAWAMHSLNIHASVANRLGLWRIKWEIEDLAFRFAEPEDYRRIAALLESKRAARELDVAQAVARLDALLREQGLVADVRGRPKHIYSIWRKMRGKALSFEQLMDLRALRVLVDEMPDCYRVLAMIHATWTVLDGEFDDYIARPKANGYQSLHTVVVDDTGKPLEVQIRTKAMHAHAEEGGAAHWFYKEAGAMPVLEDAQRRILMARQLLDLTQSLQERSQELSPAGEPSAPRHVYVLTPRAQLVELPWGATPVDLAYTLHSDLGHRCRGARVDGALVPLDTPLQNGQTVEIISAKSGGPSRDWLKPGARFLVSARARAKVRAWFNAEWQGRTVQQGRETLQRWLARLGASDHNLQRLAEALGFKGSEALSLAVGKEELRQSQVERAVRPDSIDAGAMLTSGSLGGSGSETLSKPAIAGLPGLALGGSGAQPSGGKPEGGLLVLGVDRLLTQLARCCAPVPGDAVAGFVTRGRGVSVHRQDCPNLRTLLLRDPDRMVAVSWGDAQASVRSALQERVETTLQLDAEPRTDLLQQVANTLAKLEASLSEARRVNPRTNLWLLRLRVSDRVQLDRVMRELALLPGVHRVTR